MMRIRARSLWFVVTFLLPAPAILAAGGSCSLEGLAGGPDVSSTSGDASASSSSSSGMGAALVYEAESAKLSGKFVVGESPDASAGAFVYVPAGSGCKDGLSAVRFDVVVDTDGNYAVWTRGSADAPDHDSFFISVDQADAAVITMPVEGGFEEETVYDSNLKMAILYPFTAGSHQVVISCREDGTSLDRIRLEATAP